MTPGSARERTRRLVSLPDLDQAKSAVLNTLSSADARRGYRHATDEFIEWYCSEPRLSFNRAVVARYRMYLEDASSRPALSVSPLAAAPLSNLPGRLLRRLRFAA